MDNTIFDFFELLILNCLCADGHITALVANSLLTMDQGATLLQVLEIAGLLKAYEEFICLFSEAESLFVQGDTRSALNLFYKIWMSPHFVPALLLYECFYARQLILPTWSGTSKHYVVNMLKKSGGTRPIIIPNKRTRICMGVVNTLLQSACKSWSTRSTGFRLGHGTHTAIDLLANSARKMLHVHDKVYILTFDIHKAFNSVNMKHLFHTLGLKALPHDIKNMIWKWQHTSLSAGLLCADRHITNAVLDASASNTGAHGTPAVVAADLSHNYHSISSQFATNPTVVAADLSHNYLSNNEYSNMLIPGFFINQYSNSLLQGFSYSPTLFAWYLDVILVQHSSLIAYADNFAGVYGSIGEAEQALLNVRILLNTYGFSINEKSISIFVRYSNSAQALYPWLGHGLSLPDCSVILNKFQQKAPASEPVPISLEMWHTMLQSTNWVQNVHNIEWRNQC
uniref:Reverse transcriptase-like protein n=1 Tax=Yamagishiella unicocca TaxID=51707 RepID=A0A1P8VWG9_9CHLO|nr:reverse transcriptase-like protein [Yamagishiella unicocca]APZ82953.1 reverse transcriptase-like protein [Yamagishiella unicocca]